MRKVEIFAVEGIPEVEPGDDLAVLIEDALIASGANPRDGDIVVVSQKVVSKAEGHIVLASEVKPSSMALELAEGTGKSPEHLEVILRNSTRIVKMDRGRGIFIMETPHGFVCANAGVDRSNAGQGEAYAVLPEDPDRSASFIRHHLEAAFGVRLAVVVSDTFGRPWRRGQTDVALGVSGINPLLDYRGKRDSHGYELKGTMVALVDEVASAAELVKGKLADIPVALVRGVTYDSEPDSISELIRDETEDLFR